MQPMIGPSEGWKPVEGFPDYEISKVGRVKSLPRVVKNGTTSTMKLKEKILKFNIHRGGYSQVSLRKGGRSFKVYVHRLVAVAFLSNPDNLPQVNHEDGDKSNNREDNLEWSTQSDNNLHAYRTGLKAAPKPEDCRDYLGKIEVISPEGEVFLTLNGTKDIVSKGFHAGCVYSCLRGERISHKGYTFKRIKIEEK